jgi:hypothetical protein
MQNNSLTMTQLGMKLADGGDQVVRSPRIRWVNRNHLRARESNWKDHSDAFRVLNGYLISLITPNENGSTFLGGKPVPTKLEGFGLNIP